MYDEYFEMVDVAATCVADNFVSHQATVAALISVCEYPFFADYCRSTILPVPFTTPTKVNSSANSAYLKRYKEAAPSRAQNMSCAVTDAVAFVATPRTVAVAAVIIIIMQLTACSWLLHSSVYR